MMVPVVVTNKATMAWMAASAHTVNNAVNQGDCAASVSRYWAYNWPSWPGANSGSTRARDKPAAFRTAVAPKKSAPRPARTAKNTSRTPMPAPLTQTCCGPNPRASRQLKASMEKAGEACMPMNAKLVDNTMAAVQIPATGASLPRPAVNCMTPGDAK